MIFTELILENFGPYKGRHIIDLRPKIATSEPSKKGEYNSPIILFGGMNGGGKTTLIDAIRLALYGARAKCSTRGNLSYNDFLNQCVNQQTLPNEQTRIELAFEHIINDEWIDLKIVRYWSKNPKDGKDTLGIIEGEWPEQSLVNNWDEYVENILPLGISNLFLFDGEQVKELAEEDLLTPAVIEAIKSLLGLELVERLTIDLDIFISRKRKDLASPSELAKLENMEAQLKHFKEEEKQLKEKLEIDENLLKKAQVKYRKISRNFREEGGKIAAESQRLKSQEEQYYLHLEKVRKEMRNLAAGALPLLLIKNQLNEAKIQGEKELKYYQAKIAKDLLEASYQRLLDYLDQLSLDDINLQKIKDFLSKENQALNEELQSIDLYLDINQKSLQSLKNNLDYVLPNQQKEADQKLVEIVNIDKEIEVTQRLLATAASPEAYQKLEEEYKKAEQDVINYKTICETNKQKLIAIERKIKETKKQLDNYSVKAIELNNSVHLFESIHKVQKTLQLFKHRLTLKKLNKLESEVTECFRYLLHKSELVHRVTIDTNNFSLSLYDNQGKNVPKNRLSAGEKQLLAISLLWGLARVSGKSLPIAIDTPLGRLDSSHRNNLVERYFPTASHQVILLSTDTEISQKEVENLRNKKAIALEYLLEYDQHKNQTIIKKGYFC